MSNSTEKSNKSKSTNKKSKAEPFVWTDDEVDLLLSVVLEYKVSRTSENIDWETCQSKYSDILELFQAQYPSPENAAQLGKEFPRKENELTKLILTSKMKAIRSKFRAAIDSGRKSGHGRVVLLFFDICQDIWGGSPATTTLASGIETAEISREQELEVSISCEIAACPSSYDSDSSRPNTPSTRPISPSPRSPSCVAEQSFEFESEAETRDPGSLKERRDLLNNRLKGYRQEKLKRKLSVDNQLLNIAQEDIEMKKKIFAKIDDMDKQQADNMKKLSSNMEQLTSSIVDGFAMLHQMMMQPPAIPPQFTPHIGYQTNMYNRMPSQYPPNQNMEKETSNNQYGQSLQF